MNKMKMYDPALLSALKNADNFMLCAHINPDGDAIGSMLALGRLLRKMGKTALMVCPDPIPTHLMWLPDIGLIRPVEALEGVPLGAAFCVDVSEPKRLGSAWEYYRQAPVRFVVDHHPGTGELAHYALIDPQMPAAGQMVFALWQELGMALDSEAAAQLYAAISTDTGNFCFNSVQPETFGCMEELLRVGFDLSEASRRLFLVRTRGGAQALGRVLSSLKFFAGGRATCMLAPDEDAPALSAARARQILLKRADALWQRPELTLKVPAQVLRLKASALNELRRTAWQALLEESLKVCGTHAAADKQQTQPRRARF